MCELSASQIQTRKEASEMKHFTSYWYTETNLQSSLMMCELLIHNFINEIEAIEMKHLTTCLLIANTESNLQAVLTMYEVWVIENFR